MRRLLLLLGVFVGGVLAYGELVSWSASRRGVREGRTGARRTVVVLGYGNRGIRPNAVNRFRVRAALRTLRGPDDELLFTGGAVHGVVPEAEVMARYAARRGFTGRVRTETASRTTAENVRNVIPLLEDAEEIAIVSNSVHAEKARLLLTRARPDLARRLIRAEDHRFGEIPVIPAISAIRGVGEVRRLRREVAVSTTAGRRRG